MIAARRIRVTGHGAVDVCAFLNRFTVTAIGEAITERAVNLRGERKLKLPDAIILATAIESRLMLVTRNTCDFGDTLPGVHHPYRV